MIESGDSNEKRISDSVLKNNPEEYKANNNKVVLPALNSNDIAFGIFSYFKQPEAQIILRSLSKKSLEKSSILHKYCNSPGNLV